MVRGFALFGVLLVNMFGFGADSIAWNAPLDQLTLAITHVFFDSKSWTLFSILFGFGFALQMQKSTARGHALFPSYIRRLVTLFAIGAVHTLLYDGDILVLYAELGLGLLLIRRFPARWLLLMSVGLMLVFPLAHLVTPERDEIDEAYLESVIDARTELEWESQTHIYATGSLKEIVSYNAPTIKVTPFEDFQWADSGLAVFAMFLLGFTIGRSGIMNDIPGRLRLFSRVRFWGLGIGLTAMAAEQALTARAGYAVYHPSKAAPEIMLAGDLLFVIGTVALALAYASMIVLAAQSQKGRAILSPLVGVGRMALTVYLTQTLIFTTLFYGYGFGAAYRLGPAAVTVCALVIFTVQILGCKWWLSRFRFGPVEWLWRSVTYLKWQPLRLVS
jgi:uncharacterized protein